MIGILPFFIFPIAMLISMLMVLRTGRGLPQISHPYCSKCNYDLRVNWNTVGQCPECGNDLEQGDAVYFGRSAANSMDRKSQNRWLIFALILFMLVLLVNLFMNLVTNKARPVPVAPVNPMVVPAIPNRATPTPPVIDQVPGDAPISRSESTKWLSGTG